MHIPLRLRPAATMLLVFYWLAMFAGTHWPHPPSIPGGQFDKVLHFGGFAGLALLMGASWSLRKPLSFGRYLFAAAVMAVYGALDELTQMLVPGRHCEFLDWCADLAGALAGLACFALAMRYLRRKFPASGPRRG